MELAYHFVADTLRDGSPILADGEWLEHDGEVVICKSGLHASSHPFDALQYAPGKTLCLVEVEGVVTRQEDKLVAKRRRIVKRIDAEPLMREFSRWCALQVIELWDAPEVVRQYLTTGDESLRAAARDAARDAARAAAWAAARDAAWAAAWAAARDAAWAAAWAAARDAARDAARAAAWAAARDAAWAAAWAAARDAAWAAAWAAARDAARDAQRDRFKKMVDGAFRLEG
ncbi:hypothetical protein ABIE51_001422 [Lysobacter sp. OAE881]